jgi:alkaline phosphatase D
MEFVASWIDSLNPKPVQKSASSTTAPADPIEEAEAMSEAPSVEASATSKPTTEILDSLLVEHKPREITPEFMLMIGDAIYADVPYWNGDNLEAYRKLYRRTFASPSFRQVYERLRKYFSSQNAIITYKFIAIFGMYDDHEIVNNFAGENDETKAPFANASSAFNTYYGNANPDPHYSDVNFYDFRYGDNAFFVLDTRRYRSRPNANADSTEIPTMLGEKQLHAFHSWLGKVNTTTTFKFVISTVPFTSLWQGYDGQKDSWAGYRFERDALLDVLQYVPNVVILSGDRHEFAFIEHRGKVPEISGRS